MLKQWSYLCSWFSNQNRSPCLILRNCSRIILWKSSPGPSGTVSKRPPVNRSMSSIVEPCRTYSCRKRSISCRMSSKFSLVNSYFVLPKFTMDNYMKNLNSLLIGVSMCFTRRTLKKVPNWLQVKHCLGISFNFSLT